MPVVYFRMFYRDNENDAMLPSAAKVKQDVVHFAKTCFAIEFSRCYDIRILQGPEWPIEDLVLAVNWTGVYILDDGDIIYELSYSEIATVTRLDIFLEELFVFLFKGKYWVFLT